MVKSWDQYFFDLLPLIASRSKDESTKVGSIIVGPNHEIRSTGYNSFPRGVRDDVPERQTRPLKYVWVSHAERNAVYNSARTGTPTEGCTIYVDWIPCSDCAMAIIQSGIIAVVIDGRDYWKKKLYWDERWKDKMLVSVEMLKEAGITIRVWCGETDWLLTDYEKDGSWLRE